MIIITEKGDIGIWQEATWRSTKMITYDFNSWKLRVFCLGSVGPYGTIAEGGVGVGGAATLTKSVSSKICWHRQSR